jgi:hypothetical protein
MREKNSATLDHDWTLSVWAMGHGLNLDLRCRFKVMDMEEEAITAAIEKSIDEYHEIIKA